MGADSGSGDARFDVFGRLMKNRVIMLGTDVNDDIANQICAQLLYLEGEDSNADIWLYINSPGGSITAGMAIISLTYPAKPLESAAAEATPLRTIANPINIDNLLLPKALKV